MAIMKLRAAAAAAVILLVSALPALAEIDPAAPLPMARDIKVGKLANGFTYYIKQNAKPEKRLELRLVVKAGSMLEDDDQRGLAHVTEHMAFNGSNHFKRHELVSYLQSIGVKFGADLNAYTGFDETVYILPLPLGKKEDLDKGFQVLEDWAHGLVLNDADIESERAIVLEELRLRGGTRNTKDLYAKRFNNERYGDRLPSGTVESLHAFAPEAVKRFYRDWYRPDLMAVIVVGDIDPAEAEQLVNKHFGKMAGPAAPRPRIYAEIPPYAANDALVQRYNEAPSNTVTITYPAEPHRPDNTMAGYRAQLIERLYTSMLSLRLAELAQSANPPFIQGSSARSTIAPGYRMFQSNAVLGKGGAQPAVTALIQENERARRHGFTAAELERARKSLMSAAEVRYRERDTINSASVAVPLIRSFLLGEALPGPAYEYEFLKELLPAVTLEEVNGAAAKALPSGQPKLAVYGGSDRGEVRAPSRDALLAAAAAAEATPLPPLVEKVYGASLMDTLPKPGSIVKESVNQALGITELSLSNGVRVVLKPTSFKTQQVLMGGFRPGGQSLYDAADLHSARLASSIVAGMGLMDYAPLELGKVLAGKSVQAAVNISELYENVNASAGTAEVETMLQLVHLRFTRPRKDENLFASYIAKQRELATARAATSDAVFGDKITGAMYNDHPLLPRLMQPADYDKLKLDRVAEIYRERFSSAKDFTFVLVGSFEVDKLKPLLATYLGSLPVADIPTAFRDRGVRPATGLIKTDIYRGSEKSSRINLRFTSEAPYSEDEAMRVRALAEVLNIKLVDVLRDEKGLLYTGSFTGKLSKQPYGQVAFSANLPCASGSVPKVIAATMDLLKKMQEQGPDPADLAKVKTNWILSYRRALQDNGFWLNGLQGAYANGSDPAILLRDEQRIAAITPESLREVAKRYIKFDNYVQAVLHPETK
ncbi:insulinase family protein [Massilia sp. FT127W]|uniref:Insulinase family protein n=2 Tax=Pseudoduganella aquatica TaxID=2660641 RepID=A0A7X4HCM2_9BURK|nr:insulinase family protein [Pseudoduganella aquatica]